MARSHIRDLYVIRSAGVSVASRLAARADDTDTSAPPADGTLGTLEVDFSRFDNWYRIDSFWEGTFLERTVRGSFKRTISQNPTPKVLFNHGFDFNIGDKVLGVPEVLEERPTSPHLEAPLLDTSYNRDLAPGLRAGAYGSSFMFEVLQDSWDHEPEKSDHNPDGIPERTISEVRLFEAGPVTWPANPEATAGLRSNSGADWYVQALADRNGAEPDELVRLFKAFRAYHGLRTPQRGPATPVPDLKTPAPARAARHVDSPDNGDAARRARVEAKRALKGGKTK